MITVDLPKAKEIAHKHRRATRAELFQPLDVQATIPMYATKAEAARQAIRDQFADLQVQIDNADCVDVLKQLIHQCNQCKEAI